MSAWLPGTFGSLAAVPSQPGFAAATTYYHTSVSAGRDVRFDHGGVLFAGIDATGDLVFENLSYVFANPVLGGQAAISLTGAFGNAAATAEATFTGPGGGTIGASRSASVTSYGDLYPMATLKWNQGVNNFMVYTWGDLPVGDYDPTRLANIGIGHGAWDAGAGYTYFNPMTGHEFSAVAGFTYNFMNPETDYQNGIDFHVDWGLSQFLSPQVQVGLVGYYYDQITGDSGSGARLGAFESRVAGIGPQLGYIFPAGDWQGYLGVKGYYEFAAEHRLSGWNAWVTLAFSPAAKKH